jgi:hypothetical protein
MMKIMAAAAALTLVAGNAQAVDVTVWSPAMEGCTIVWDAIVPDLTEQAQLAGYKCAYQTYKDNSMGIWSSDAHSLSAIAANRGITRENLVSAMEESSEYRSEILYLERQTLIEACLANVKYRLLYLLGDDYVASDAVRCGDAQVANDSIGTRPDAQSDRMGF